MLPWLQALLWIGFILLPYSGQYDESTGSVSFKRAELLWARALLEGASDQAQSKRGTEPNFESAASDRFSQSGVTPRAATKKRRNSLLGGISLLGGNSLLGGATRLFGSKKPMLAPLHISSGRSFKGRVLDSSYHRLPEGHASHRSEKVEEGSWRFTLRKWANNGRANAMAATYPVRTGATENRLFSLLRWDTRSFKACTLLFGLMMVVAYDAKEQHRALQREADMGELSRAAHGVWDVAYSLLTDAATFRLWDTWQSHITFEIVKLVFALTTFPFFIFMVDALNTLFTHTDATGYTPSGSIIGADLNGLSAYLGWIKEDILSEYSPWNSEFDDHSKFKERDMAKLHEIIEEGEQCLLDAWQRPGSAVRVTRKKMLDIDAALAKVVTRESASEELFRRCFPDKVLIDEYWRKLKLKEQSDVEERELR